MDHYSSKLFKIIADGGLNLSVYKEYDLTTEGIRQTQLDISECREPDFVLIQLTRRASQ